VWFDDLKIVPELFRQPDQQVPTAGVKRNGATEGDSLSRHTPSRRLNPTGNAVGVREYLWFAHGAGSMIFAAALRTRMKGVHSWLLRTRHKPLQYWRGHCSRAALATRQVLESRAFANYGAAS
jgi:hypothetical protein